MWLYNLLIGCNHKWEIISKGDIIDNHNDVTGTYYHLQCGKLKNFKGI